MNHALIVRVAGEFQGFCRDLYLESADFVSACVTDPGLANIMQLQFGTGMQLSRANATSESLAKDFKRFGFPLWQEMAVVYPFKSPAWRASLAALNDARNAIAHQDDLKLAAVRAAQPLTLATARRWRSSLGSLARGMDNVVGKQVKLLIGAAPW
ncbi:hypothetical protein [Curtobacterium sp. MCBA15_009]|uniref:hypothetical protein n=1 Tax=Curtobacterium sp. MCBA15_009 TaxID=1898737 RepID=UPI001113C9CE|nr:hypothetical protein [Curtobacterium sp. MCBA15_009]